MMTERQLQRAFADFYGIRGCAKENIHTCNIRRLVRIMMRVYEDLVKECSQTHANQWFFAELMSTVNDNTMSRPRYGFTPRHAIYNGDNVSSSNGKVSGSAIFECPRCNKRNSTYYGIQTRSADEPLTYFVNCLECRHRFRR